jgi:hypothetical protein
MAINIIYMRKAIQANGHLQLVGDETREELREALLFLYDHSQARCHKPGLGTPVRALMPIESLYRPTRVRPYQRPVKDVELP